MDRSSRALAERIRAVGLPGAVAARLAVAELLLTDDDVAGALVPENR